MPSQTKLHSDVRSTFSSETDPDAISGKEKLMLILNYQRNLARNQKKPGQKKGASFSSPLHILCQQT
jgi:hypothetical protein